MASETVCRECRGVGYYAAFGQRHACRGCACVHREVARECVRCERDRLAAENARLRAAAAAARAYVAAEDEVAAAWAQLNRELDACGNATGGAGPCGPACGQGEARVRAAEDARGAAAATLRAALAGEDGGAR